MKAVEDLFASIVASRPPGHFDAVEPLLRRFCEIAIEARRETADLNAVGVDDPRAGEILA